MDIIYNIRIIRGGGGGGRGKEGGKGDFWLEGVGKLFQDIFSVSSRASMMNAFKCSRTENELLRIMCLNWNLLFIPESDKELMLFKLHI